MTRTTGLVAGMLLCACGSAQQPASSGPPRDPNTVEPAEVQGHWTGDWGDLYLRADADGTVRGVYNHDAGTVVGRIEGSAFRGWWCEAPSRAAPSDAGDVELTFMRGDSAITIDGRWRYGTEGEMREDWDLTWVDTPFDAELLARFDDPSAFCAHP